MVTVATSELEKHLAAHLQSVRRGETLLVVDSLRPIARIVPIPPDEGVIIVREAKGRLQEVPLPQPTRSGPDVDRVDGVDVLAQLNEEREERL